MNYCDRCNNIFIDDKCPHCNSKKVREVRDDDYCFIIEKELIWAEALRELLDKNNIPYEVLTKYGAGLSIKMGPYNEVYRFYIPYKYMEQATNIISKMFNVI